MNQFITHHLRITIAVAFTVFALVMLAALNGDYLFAVQNHSLFLSTRQFFADTVAVPGGVTQWVGCFLTQFFAYPWVGSCMLAVLWLAIYWLLSEVMMKYHHETGLLPTILPLLAVSTLLISVIDLGYWFYYIKIPGYWFTETLYCLLAALFIYCSSYLYGRHIAVNIIYILLVASLGYALAGFWALAALLAIALLRPFRLIPAIVCAAGIVAAPLLSYLSYTSFRLEDAWTICFPVFASFQYVSWSLSVPFCVTALTVIAIPVMPALRLKHTTALSAVSFAAIAVVTVLCNYSNTNFHKELRMSRYAMAHQWNKVVREMDDITTSPTRQMVMMREQALIHQGRFGDEFRPYAGGGTRPDTFDSLQVKMIHTAAPLLYMNYGQTNYATRWCIENGVEFGFSVDDYKILALCALAQQEYRLAKKYIDILYHTTFHHSWAAHYERLVYHHDLIDQYPVVKTIREMSSVQTNRLTGDKDMVEAYLVNILNAVDPKDSPLMRELTLAFAMKAMDSEHFWTRFAFYAQIHQDEPMPIHYQEAAYIFAAMQQQERILHMPFDQERIVRRYAAFSTTLQSLQASGLPLPQAGEAMKTQFGDTYWWYLLFCTQDNFY